MANLCLHRGGRIVDRTELATIPAPEPTDTWFPVPHIQVLETTESTLADMGFSVTRAQLGLSSNNAQFFGTLDVLSSLGNGRSLAVGIRSSINKTFPHGFCAGARVFVCDNLSFSAELLVSRKHTRYGELRFQEAISLAVGQLPAFLDAEMGRIGYMEQLALTDQAAESLILRAYETEIISSRELPRAIAEWRKPPFQEFEPRNAWSLFNAFTAALGQRATRNPQQHAYATMRLQGLLCPDLADTSVQDQPVIDVNFSEN